MLAESWICNTKFSSTVFSFPHYCNFCLCLDCGQVLVAAVHKCKEERMASSMILCLETSCFYRCIVLTLQVHKRWGWRMQC